MIEDATMLSVIIELNKNVAIQLIVKDLFENEKHIASL